MKTTTISKIESFIVNGVTSPSYVLENDYAIGDEMEAGEFTMKDLCDLFIAKLGYYHDQRGDKHTSY